MTSNHILYNLVPLGFTLLLCYIFLDLIFDYFRQEKPKTLTRFLFYLFLFYTLSLIQVKWGGITVPIQSSSDTYANYITANEWFGIYEIIYKQISIGNGFKEIFFNTLIFIPFGILISILVNTSNIYKKVLFVILITLGIAISRLFLEWGGLVMKSTNITDIIYFICNISGGIIGIWIVILMSKIRDANNYLDTPKMANNQKNL